MDDYEYERLEAEEASDEVEESAEYVSEYSGLHRIMGLLIIVLVIGVVLLGLFIATRSGAAPVPTLKPPWLV